MNLAEFLQARIVEDQQHAFDYGQAHAVPMSLVVATHQITAEDDPVRRVLAECEAKRRIVDEFTSAAAWSEQSDCPNPDEYRRLAGAMLTCLRHLALSYADHEAYQQEWQPA